MAISLGASRTKDKNTVRGQMAGDFIYVILIFFIISIFLFLLYYTSKALEGPLQNVTGFNSIPMCGNSKIGFAPCFTGPLGTTLTPYNGVLSILNKYTVFDSYIPWLFVLVNLAVIASAILVFSNFLAYAIGFVIQIITIILSFILSNQARLIFSQGFFANVITAFPNIVNLWHYLPVYEIIFTMIFLIIIAAKARITGPAAYNGGATL